MLAGRHVDDASRNKEWRDFAHAAFEHFLEIVFDGLNTTNAGTQRDADPVAILFSNLDSRVPDGIDRSADAVVDERVVLALVFLGKVSVDVKALYETGYARRVRTRIEILDDHDAGITLVNVSPGIIQGATYR